MSKDITKKLNKFVITSIVVSILFLIVGVILVVFPEVSLNTIIYIIGAGLIISGLFFMFDSSERLLFMSFLSVGVLQIIMGIVILAYPNLFKTLVPIVIGIWMIVKSTMDCKFTVILKDCGYNNWFLVLCLSILSIACGIMIIFNPQIGSLALTTVLGSLIIVYSVSAIVDSIIFKDNVKEIVKYLKA